MVTEFQILRNIFLFRLNKIMEIVVQIQSFSFYHESKTIYLTGDALQLVIKENNHPDLFRFKTLKTGQKLSFKSKTVDFIEVVKTLTERVIFIKVVGVELSRDCKNPTAPKLIFDSLKSCDISAAN
jgi:hypothetical protein